MVIAWFHIVQKLTPAEISHMDVHIWENGLDIIWRGDVKPVKYLYGLPMLLGKLEQLTLLRLLLEHPGIYLNEMQEKLLQMFGVTVNMSTICNTQIHVIMDNSFAGFLLSLWCRDCSGAYLLYRQIGLQPVYAQSGKLCSWVIDKSVLGLPPKTDISWYPCTVVLTSCYSGLSGVKVAALGIHKFKTDRTIRKVSLRTVSVWHQKCKLAAFNPVNARFQSSSVLYYSWCDVRRRKIIHHMLLYRDQIKLTAETSMYYSAMFVWTDESGCDSRNCTEVWIQPERHTSSWSRETIGRPEEIGVTITYHDNGGITMQNGPTWHCCQIVWPNSSQWVHGACLTTLNSSCLLSCSSARQYRLTVLHNTVRKVSDRLQNQNQMWAFMAHAQVQNRQPFPFENRCITLYFSMIAENITRIIILTC